VLLLLNERLGRREAVGVKAHVHLILSQSVVRKVHVYHVIAEAAFLGEGSQLVLVLLFDSLDLLLHLSKH
jgi:hypothetical protein